MTRNEAKTAVADWIGTKQPSTQPVPTPRIDVTPERLLNITFWIVLGVSACYAVAGIIHWVHNLGVRV